MPETPDGGWLLDDRECLGPYGKPKPKDEPKPPTKREGPQGSSVKKRS